MIARALALKDMDRTNGTVRTRFNLMFVTADRVKWAKKCKLIERANAAEGDEKIELLKQANEIKAAGLLVVGTNCANSAARGMHSTAKKAAESEALKAPSHFKNRTKNIAFNKSDVVRKMHCGLLLRYNSEKIVY